VEILLFGHQDRCFHTQQYKSASRAWRGVGAGQD
jgi:hypothetical protein